MEKTRPIRVLLVDDHAVVRSGLVAFLAVYDDLELAGQAGDGREAVQKCAELRPDVVLMDLVMPGEPGSPVMGGVSATQAIRERWPETQVVVLTGFKEDDLVNSALRAGAIGYLLKNASAGELAGAIRAAAAGRPTLSPEAAQALIQASRDPAPPRNYDLTGREREILALMARGLNNLEIARELLVSRSTVKFHVSSLLTRLGAASRTEAVAIAVQNHLI